MSNQNEELTITPEAQKFLDRVNEAGVELTEITKELREKIEAIEAKYADMNIVVSPARKGDRAYDEKRGGVVQFGCSFFDTNRYS